MNLDGNSKIVKIAKVRDKIEGEELPEGSEEAVYDENEDTEGTEDTEDSEE